MARYAAEGARVLVATLTGGEAGSILNPAMDKPEIRENISEVRREEMEKARQILGVEQQFMGFVDSGLPEGDPLPPLPEGSFALQPLEQAAEPLVRAIREFRPHVMTTYDESGGYPHPDHIMTHKVSMEAFRAAADPKRYPDAGEPWQVLKVYYNAGMRRKRFDVMEKAMLAKGLESPFGEFRKRWANARPWPELVATTQVPCADHFETRDQALIAHATQIDPNSFWFACPREIEQEVWPHEEFHLVWSMVPVELPEDDLFGGIRGTEAAT